MPANDRFSGTLTVAWGLKVAPLLVVRPGELRAEEWEEFDLEGLHPTWRIPPVRLKHKKAVKDDPKTPPHLVPLSRHAIAILKELKPLTVKQRFVFPRIRNPRQPMSENTINASLRLPGYAKDTTTEHDLRHTATTLLHNTGCRGDAHDL